MAGPSSAGGNPVAEPKRTSQYTAFTTKQLSSPEDSFSVFERKAELVALIIASCGKGIFELIFAYTLG